jgi:hypothetical protein
MAAKGLVEQLYRFLLLSKPKSYFQHLFYFISRLSHWDWKVSPANRRNLYSCSTSPLAAMFVRNQHQRNNTKNMASWLNGKIVKMYMYRGKKVQLLVFWDWSRNGRHLINYRHCLRSLPNRHFWNGGLRVHSTRSRKWWSLPVACPWLMVLSGYSGFFHH